MKKITSLMVVLALLALAGTVYAGERAGAFSISPFVGGYMYDEDEQPELQKNRILSGLRLGYDVTDSFGVELVGHYVWAKDKARDKHIDAWSYRLDLLYNFMPRSTVVPYLAMGGGGQILKYGSGLDDRHDGTFNLGGGVKFFMTDSFALRLDARHILDFANEDLDDDIIHNWEYSAGLSFLFGGREAAVAAVSPVTTPAPEPEAKPETPLEPMPAAEPTPGHHKYCVTLQGEYDIDQAVVRPENYEEIAEVGNFMKKYPTTTAVIEGHTDNVGSASHNMELSQRRAESVVDHLVTKFGIDRSRLSAKGFGFTRPIADNTTNEGRQKNRRIEAIVDCAFDVQQVQPPDKLCMTLVIDFDSGKADIKPQYRSEIARVADYMKQYPTTTALIEGHTDNTGSAAANMKLSQQRAENVVNYLVDNFGIDRSRLSAKGYGSTMRLAYNNTPEGRQKNRRINAVIDCVITK
ncbi:MAG: hypothetical protein A2075_17540 [Geobacteraceae bacterium GWC2_58_44]|nr:MAG: hypothetical protein A2075_17540 [Geobacteraceae bacterium GWC2_58_44]HBG08376.1 hypothetical protein [Geobacter sp.]